MNAPRERDTVRCGYCGKVSYNSERAAIRVLRTRHHQDRPLMNAYRCESGGVGYHIGHTPRVYEWPAWDDAARELQCDRCPTVIAEGEPVARLGTTSLCFDCGDLAEIAAISKAAS